MKHWHNGVFWSGIEVSANAPGTTKYWHDGTLYGDTFPAAAGGEVFVARAYWFF